MCGNKGSDGNRPGGPSGNIRILCRLNTWSLSKYMQLAPHRGINWYREMTATSWEMNIIEWEVYVYINTPGLNWPFCACTSTISEATWVAFFHSRSSFALSCFSIVNSKAAANRSSAACLAFHIRLSVCLVCLECFYSYRFASITAIYTVFRTSHQTNPCRFRLFVSYYLMVREVIQASNLLVLVLATIRML